MPGIGVITNPLSRQNRRNPKLARRLAYILGNKGPLEQPRDLDSLMVTCQGFRDAQIDVLCINGGDGTVHKVLTRMIRAYVGQPLPRIVLLRGGTMNTIAHGLGIRGSPAEILDYVVARYHADVPMPTARRWALEVDGEQYGFLFGNGVIGKFLEVYEAGSEPTPTKAAWLLARGILSAMVGGAFARKLFEPFRGTITVDGEPWPERPWMAIAAGTTDDIGFGFRPFFQCLHHPGKMHLVGVATSPWGLVKELPRIYRAKPPASDDIPGEVCGELVLRAEEPISYMIDGDFHRGGQTLTVRVGPPVDFVVPDDV